MRAARALRSALAAAVVALLAACASIPSSGPVHEGNPVDTGDDLGFDFRPQGPEEGDTPIDILSGFIAAGAGPQDNYGVARQFLTRELAREWDPGAGVLIHSRAVTTLQDSDTALRLLVPATGSVDATGRYDEFANPVPLELPFGFVQEGGEWRISQAPDGTVLATAIFDRLFAQRSLYFYDPTFTYLVPDLRWFPTTADAMTRIVEALLAGPSEPLAPPVLATAFPEGVRLEQQSVTETGGTATVELNNAVVQADGQTRQWMLYQLERTLVGGSILSVRISVDDTPLEVPDFPSGSEPVVQPVVNPSALVGRSGSFGFLSGNDLTPLNGFSETVSALAPTAGVYSAELDLAAVLAGDGKVYAVPRGEPAVALDSRQGLLAPALDAEGFVWTVPGGSPGELAVSRLGGDSGLVAAQWGDATRIVSIAVSRDSTRLLTLLETPAGPALRVYGIVRDSGLPTALSATWFDLVPPGPTAVTATWVSDTTVASLGRSADGAPLVTTQQIGGRRLDSTSAVSDAVALVGGNGLSGLRILESDGDLLVLRGTAWQPTATEVGFLATQQ
ncbi:LpqB family beta-propeller domain-containing protein [Naasia sp. SYSU D00948]|uniref:LpqB family beta-propeller domain-containing protein n=1 Tax=Naasia sp. SYSU D00948 TaxID=2817379 RepID=UPI001B3061FB|nr:LpqB family beta-propeller domain-containing protein [Naasia sp. SYSU D00948]